MGSLNLLMIAIDSLKQGGFSCTGNSFKVIGTDETDHGTARVHAFNSWTVYFLKQIGKIKRTFLLCPTSVDSMIEFICGLHAYFVLNA